jgi:Protein of unknown function (DUF2889)
MSGDWVDVALHRPDDRVLHPRRGTHAPVSGTPQRRAGSVRRTITTDQTRPDGVDGELRLVGRGRDLLTDGSGTAHVHSEASLSVLIDFAGRRLITAIDATPTLADIDRLIGVSAAAGFRTALDAIAASEHDAQTLLYSLLDDVPTATLVSGFAAMYAGWSSSNVDRKMLQMQADLCSGWATDATIMLAVADGEMPPLVTGPIAPSLARSDDALAWHELPTMPGHSMRRHRRMDVWREGDHLGVDILFRDSHMSPDDLEQSIHEYTVEATIDPIAMTIIDIVATPRALPWIECPRAAASAGRLAGELLAGLRPKIRNEFVGASTCTHLNDTLRSMEDLRALVNLLP